MEIPKEPIASSPQNEPEKETLPDFASIFRERLKNAQPVPAADRELKAMEYRAMDIATIEKTLPAAFFVLGDYDKGDCNLWILPENDPQKRVYHKAIWDDYQANFGNTTDFIFGPISGHLIIGSSAGSEGGKKTILALHEDFADIMVGEKAAGDEDFFRKWRDFMKKYEIDTVVGSFRDTLNVGKQKSVASPEEILNQDMLGEMRENKELLKIAKDNQLNNRDMIRMFALYFAHKKANEPFDCWSYARKIREEREGKAELKK